MQDVLTNEGLIPDFRHHERAVALDGDDVVEVGAVTHEFVLFQAVAHETVGAVHVELLVGNGYFLGRHYVEGAELRFTLAARAILFQQALEIVDGVAREVG